MFSSLFRIRVLLACLFVIGLPLLGQTGLGSITGVVQDSSGGIVPGATVRLTEKSTQSVRTASSNEAGLFTFRAVQVGAYTVAISHAGFKEKKIDNLSINAFQQMSLGQITLDVGA